MKELIAYCGLNCENCDARLATVNNDEELRKRTAKLWSELYGAEITPDTINCVGCRIDGVKFPFCDSRCRIRQCGMSRGFATCGDCPELHSCEKVGAVHKNAPDALKNLQKPGEEAGGMEVSLLSKRYSVRRLTEADAAVTAALCRGNTLYYHYCPPFVTEQSIIEDMKALPPKKELSDKYFVGYFDGERLIAVMDLILAYPNEQTAFIGLFMTDTSVQNRGVGRSIIKELCEYLSRIGFSFIRLGWVKGNPQAEHFWHMNGFVETGVTYDTENYTVVVAQRGI